VEYPSEEHRSFIVLPHTFPAIRAFEDDNELTHLTSTTITLKFSCSPIGNTAEDGTKAMVGFQRLRTWLEAVINNIIFINVKSAMLIPMQSGVSNMMLYTPGKTDDALLATLFHSKASSITKDLLDIHTIWMTSTDTENTERYYRCDDGRYELPGIEYYNDLEINKEIKSINNVPWWERPTIDICEYGADPDDNDVVWFEVDPLLEIGKEYLTNDTKADIIVFDNLKNDEDEPNS